MNDKYKEAYNNWIKNRDYHFDMDGEAWLNKEVVSIYSETKDAWQAACEYKQREIDEIYATWEGTLKILNLEMKRLGEK